jgi:hypothetical protein
MADEGKYEKSSVDYSRSTGEDRCGECTFFISPDGCRRVKGKIEASYWCRLFKRKMRHAA